MTRPATRVAILATAAIALVACGRESRPVAEPTPSTSASPSGSASPSVQPSPSPAGTMRVPVYSLGETHRGPKLYREFRSVPRSSAVIRAAVDAMLHLTPLDPDYRSLWPRSTRILAVSLSGDLATVDLSREATTGSAGSSYEEMSLQQLVWTVTAAAPAVRRVQLLVEGQRVETLWGHADARAPGSRRPAIDVLAAVWVIDPAYSATVGRTFAFSGDASVFEGTVSWDVRQCTTATTCTTQLRHGFTTTDGAPARGAWSVTVTIPGTVPGGSYLEIRAWEDSAEDGRPLFRDTKLVRLG